MSAIPAPASPRALLDAVFALRRAALEYEHTHQDRIDALPLQRRASARNLLHYIAVRQADLRPLQTQLAQLGLSSLGMLETHVLAALDAVLDRLEDLLGHARSPRPAPSCTFAEGMQLLQHNTVALLNPSRPEREVRIMVTLATEAAQDAAGLRALAEAGMDIARINCAHDDATVWQRMAELVHGTDASLAACRALVVESENGPQRGQFLPDLQAHSPAMGQKAGEKWAAAAHLQPTIPKPDRLLKRPPLVQIDLAGPKSRTGELLPQGRILHLRPRHDVRGQVTAPALLALWCDDGPPTQAPEGQTLLHAGALHPPLPAQLPSSTQLHVTDLRSRARQGRLISSEGSLLVFAFDRSAYLAEGMPFSLTNGHAEIAAGTLQGISEVPGELRLFVGDPLDLLREDRPGHPGQRGGDGGFTTPPQVHCTLEAAFTSAQVGQSVWLDDGRIGATIEARTDDTLQLRIIHAAPNGSRLKAEKGINFPDTRFDLPALTAKDHGDLAAMARHLDLAAMSFLRSPQDVRQLRAALTALNRDDAGVVLKIENRQAFDHLPAILLEALAHPRLGVMVARGDLAVELGFERLSEAQEEILWMCEAAHLPVIWATQILDTMARSGQPSRPEVSDAALSIRAECAMLNKGPHIVEAVRFLSGVLGRMEGHYAKRMTLRRPLSIAGL